MNFDIDIDEILEYINFLDECISQRREQGKPTDHLQEERDTAKQVVDNLKKREG